MITLVEKITNKLLILIFLFLLSSCTVDEKNIEYSYPKTEDEKRAADHGKLTGDGIILFGKKSGAFDWSDGFGSGKGVIGINTALWRSTLDTLSFMPLATVDPFGGIIITDWYETNIGSGERFKVNAMVLSSNLRSDGIKVTVFRQVFNKLRNLWEDKEIDPIVASQLEESILLKARKYHSLENSEE